MRPGCVYVFRLSTYFSVHCDELWTVVAVDDGVVGGGELPRVQARYEGHHRVDLLPPTLVTGVTSGPWSKPLRDNNNNK